MRNLLPVPVNGASERAFVDQQLLAHKDLGHCAQNRSGDVQYCVILNPCLPRTIYTYSWLGMVIVGCTLNVYLKSEAHLMVDTGPFLFLNSGVILG